MTCLRTALASGLYTRPILLEVFLLYGFHSSNLLLFFACVPHFKLESMTYNSLHNIFSRHSVARIQDLEGKFRVKYINMMYGQFFFFSSDNITQIALVVIEGITTQP